MKRIIILFSGIFLLIIACQNTPSTEPGQKASIATKEDSLYKSVIHLHDEAMPKIGKILGYQKLCQQKIDSLSRKLDIASKNLKSRYESLLAQLKAAEKGMNDWMDAFDPDPKLESTEAKEQYWEAEQLKAQKMRDYIMKALDSASSQMESN